MKGMTFSALWKIAATAALTVTASSLLPGAAAAAHASTPKPSAWPTTVSQAQQRWPGASLIKPGAHVGPGRYIFQDRSGHYDLLAVSVSVSPYGQAALPARPGAITTSYCTGCYYDVTANVSVSSFLWGNQWFDTYNGVKYGYYAWNIYETPGCSGAGSCQTPAIGTVGNYTSTVNPWDNQYINYWGCCSGTTYLRAYVTEWNGVSGWASQNP